jgi:hypothetical protein
MLQVGCSVPQYEHQHVDAHRSMLLDKVIQRCSDCLCDCSRGLKCLIMAHIMHMVLLHVYCGVVQ